MLTFFSYTLEADNSDQAFSVKEHNMLLKLLI